MDLAPIRSVERRPVAGKFALELTALPSIDEERWVPLVRDADVLLVSGGDALYLHYWMRQTGLADMLPSLTETVGWDSAPEAW